MSIYCFLVYVSFVFTVWVGWGLGMGADVFALRGRTSGKITAPPPS